MEHIDKLINEHGFTETEKEFIKGVRKEELSAAISQQQVIVALINTKSTEELSHQLKYSVGNLITSLNFTGENINRSLKGMEDSANSLYRGIDGLQDKIEEFSESTTSLTRKANNLLFWYVGTTIVIAILTALNIIVQIKN